MAVEKKPAKKKAPKKAKVKTVIAPSQTIVARETMEYRPAPVPPSLTEPLSLRTVEPIAPDVPPAILVEEKSSAEVGTWGYLILLALLAAIPFAAFFFL